MKFSDVPIEDPCQEPEERMTPRVGGRYCHRCQKNVYDLSAMSEDAAVALLALTEGQDICVSYLMDADGNLWHAPPQPPRSNAKVLPLLSAATLLAACNNAPSATGTPSSLASAVAPIDKAQETDPATPLHPNADTESAPTAQPSAVQPNALPSPTNPKIDSKPAIPTTTECDAPNAEPLPSQPKPTRPDKPMIMGRMRRHTRGECTPPYFVDKHGLRHMKPKCLKYR